MLSRTQRIADRFVYLQRKSVVDTALHSGFDPIADMKRLRDLYGAEIIGQITYCGIPVDIAISRKPCESIREMAAAATLLSPFFDDVTPTIVFFEKDMKWLSKQCQLERIMPILIAHEMAHIRQMKGELAEAQFAHEIDADSIAIADNNNDEEGYKLFAKAMEELIRYLSKEKGASPIVIQAAVDLMRERARVALNTYKRENYLPGEEKTYHQVMKMVMSALNGGAFSMAAAGNIGSGKKPRIMGLIKKKRG